MIWSDTKKSKEKPPSPKRDTLNNFKLFYEELQSARHSTGSLRKGKPSQAR